MLSKKDIEYIRKELTEAKNPLYFYDDDPDGMCSFILLYKLSHEGKGVIVKSSPVLDRRFLRKVEENHPDKIFVLDKPMMEQEFVDGAKTKIIYIDHHNPLDLKNVEYFNPKIKDPDIYIPVTRMAYQINNDPKNLWIATVGCLFDWYMPDFIDEFVKKYPHLLPEKKDLADAVYKQPVGKLVRIFSFLLKGRISEVNKCVKILTRIETPEEILNQETSQGRYIYKRFEQINQPYVALLKDAKKQVTRSKLLLYYYGDQQWSFTADLANELTNNYPEKVVLIARKKSGEMKCSLRSKTPVLGILTRALEGVEGYGGGHPNACGTVIKEHDWELFLKNLKREIKNAQ
jgi:single-stranded DNA-specific DHH superfamily exonuclease